MNASAGFKFRVKKFNMGRTSVDNFDRPGQAHKRRAAPMTERSGNWFFFLPGVQAQCVAYIFKCGNVVY